MAAAAVSAPLLGQPAHAETLMEYTLTPEQGDASSLHFLDYDICYSPYKRAAWKDSSIVDFCKSVGTLEEARKGEYAGCEKAYKVSKAEIALQSAKEQWDYEKESKAEIDAYEQKQSCEMTAFEKNRQGVGALFHQTFPNGLIFTISKP